MRAGKMAQAVKVPVDRTHKVEGENQLLQVFLQQPHVHCHMCAYKQLTHTHTNISPIGYKLAYTGGVPGLDSQYWINQTCYHKTILPTHSFGW